MPRPTQHFREKVKLLFAAGCLLLTLSLSLVACGGTSGTAEPVRLVVTPVASPTPTPLAAPTMPPVTYRVKAGDTLSGIADMFGVSVDDIVRANNIADPNSLSEGQTLTIPGRSPSPTPNIATTATPISSTVTPATPTPTPGSFATPVLPPPDVTPPLGPTTPPSSPH